MQLAEDTLDPQVVVLRRAEMIDIEKISYGNSRQSKIVRHSLLY